MSDLTIKVRPPVHVMEELHARMLRDIILKLRSMRRKKRPPVIIDFKTGKQANVADVLMRVSRDGDDCHDFTCAVCDKPGKLLCCDFCFNVVHAECIPYSESMNDDDEFACPSCLYYAVGQLGCMPKRRKHRL